MRILFAGGGTAGHINPALAVAKHMQKDDPKTKVLFVGTKNGMETQLVPKEGFDITYIDVLGFKRSLSPRNLWAVAKVFMAYRQSVKIIRDYKPDVVIGTGGYVSGPVLAAASRMKIPTLIHEQNVSPGLTSKLLSGMVDTVCISFEQSKDKFKSAKKLVCTGNPLREELFSLSQAEARAQLGLDSRPFIAAFGGSLGAKRLNEALISFIVGSKDKNDFQMLFATGQGQYDEVRELFKAHGVTRQNMPSVRLVPYIHNMAQVLAAADLVVARAGAITISEINALGKASVLIPSPNVTDNHQEYNARALENAGAAVVITEEALGEDVLTNTIRRLIGDDALLQSMRICSEEMGIRDGTQKICELIKKIM